MPQIYLVSSLIHKNDMVDLIQGRELFYATQYKLGSFLNEDFLKDINIIQIITGKYPEKKYLYTKDEIREAISASDINTGLKKRVIKTVEKCLGFNEPKYPQKTCTIV